jgi:hypothetical protein
MALPRRAAPKSIEMLTTVPLHYLGIGPKPDQDSRSQIRTGGEAVPNGQLNGAVGGQVNDGHPYQSVAHIQSQDPRRIVPNHGNHEDLTTRYTCTLTSLHARCMLCAVSHGLGGWLLGWPASEAASRRPALPPFFTSAFQTCPTSLFQEASLP